MLNYRRVDVACALIFDETYEKLLMVRNKDGDSSYWSLPGGAVEQGESLEEAAKRETKEETGLEVEIRDLYSVREVFFTESDHHALIFTFLTKINKGDIKISDPDQEILEVKWMDLDTANEHMPYLQGNLKISPERIHNLSQYYFHGEY